MAEFLTYVFIYWLVGWVLILLLERVESGTITIRDLVETMPYALIWIILFPMMLWEMAGDRGWLDKKLF